MEDDFRPGVGCVLQPNPNPNWISGPELDVYFNRLFTLADTNGDGMVTPADFTAWINAYNNNLPQCDQNDDGACTPADFTAWINNFNAGC